MALKEYFPASEHPYKKEFDALLDTLHAHTGLFSYVAHIKSGRYHHVSPSFRTITGHWAKDLEDQGVSFYLKHVPREDTLNVMKNQAAAYRSVHASGFDPEFAHIHEMRIHLRKPEGGYVEVVGLATTMAYLPTGEFDFVLLIGYRASGDDAADIPVRSETTEFLRHAKKLYRKIYPQPAIRAIKPVLTEIVIDDEQRKDITQKEKQVLRLMAKGQSTKEIARELIITENTVETHRSSIFTKFEVRNVAELIKKASKRFWLE